MRVGQALSSGADAVQCELELESRPACLSQPLAVPHCRTCDTKRLSKPRVVALASWRAPVGAGCGIMSGLMVDRGFRSTGRCKQRGQCLSSHIFPDSSHISCRHMAGTSYRAQGLPTIPHVTDIANAILSAAAPWFLTSSRIQPHELLQLREHKPINPYVGGRAQANHRQNEARVEMGGWAWQAQGDYSEWCAGCDTTRARARRSGGLLQVDWLACAQCIWHMLRQGGRMMLRVHHAG